MTSVGTAADLESRVLAMLDLTAIGDDRWSGPTVVMGMPRVFGGQVLAQALVAAGQTVPSPKTAHSLHAYFLRAGDPEQPIEYQVERVRDGRRLSCRSVSASQHGRPIATMMCSFADTTGGVSHQLPPPDAPDAGTVPTLSESAEAWGGLGPAWGGFEALEIRVAPTTVDPPVDRRIITPEQSTDLIWQRVPFALPAQELLHQAYLVYASDVMVLAAALVPHGVPIGCELAAGRLLWDGLSIDHAVWFHAPVRADDWMLFQQRSSVAGAGRAMTSAEVYSPDGTLVATVAQEGLILASPPERPTSGEGAS